MHTTPPALTEAVAEVVLAHLAGQRARFGRSRWVTLDRLRLILGVRRWDSLDGALSLLSRRGQVVRDMDRLGCERFRAVAA
ncbi:hypothetical protein [Nocardia wallacei]|uniref:hypothetical protein n=1 Tax=Nocardia wallacei TaxID=480035 RepID=UPI002458771F|nr:hypothetical protein [Nocardia wallacei]